MGEFVVRRARLPGKPLERFASGSRAIRSSQAHSIDGWSPSNWYNRFGSTDRKTATTGNSAASQASAARINAGAPATLAPPTSISRSGTIVGNSWDQLASQGRQRPQSTTMGTVPAQVLIRDEIVVLTSPNVDTPLSMRPAEPVWETTCR